MLKIGDSGFYQGSAAVCVAYDDKGRPIIEVNGNPNTRITLRDYEYLEVAPGRILSPIKASAVLTVLRSVVFIGDTVLTLKIGDYTFVTMGRTGRIVLDHHGVRKTTEDYDSLDLFAAAYKLTIPR